MGTALALFGLGTVCALGAMFPRQAFRTFEAWKFKDPDNVDPKDFVLTYQAAVGGVAAIFLYAAAITQLVFG